MKAKEIQRLQTKILGRTREEGLIQISNHLDIIAYLWGRGDSRAGEEGHQGDTAWIFIRRNPSMETGEEEERR